MDKKIKIVIGANFGDEGKGGVTDMFAKEAQKRKESCLVVCHNGGSQRGHTVIHPSGKRHVFHHFGSGTFRGADTYLSKDFILNPIIFNKEYSELEQDFGYGVLEHINCYVNKKCMVTIPSDMIVNQIAEEVRDNNRHGSCGLGIFETITRCKNSYYTINDLEDLLKLSMLDIRKILLTEMKLIRNRLKVKGISNIPEKWGIIIDNEDTINHIVNTYMSDVNMMLSRIKLRGDYILDEYDNIIFEGGQGLLLDQDNKDYYPHLTPSDTGMLNPFLILSQCNLFKPKNIEICYVTRTYLTRHGAGRLDNECDKSDINPNMIDLTNIPNEFQGSLRYAKLDVPELFERIKSDYNMDLKHSTISIMVTHIDEYDNGVIESMKEINQKEEYGFNIKVL